MQRDSARQDLFYTTIDALFDALVPVLYSLLFGIPYRRASSCADKGEEAEFGA